MQKKKTISILDIVQTVVSLCFLLGILFVFGPCGPKEDGGWMTCHWAGRAVTGVAALLLVLALVRLPVKDSRIKLGLDIAVLPAALLAALIPGRLISLCMMADMRCRSVMQPAVTVFAILLIVLSAADILLLRKKK